MPEPLLILRAKGFIPENVSEFFNISENNMEKKNNDPQKILNVDETGIIIVQRHEKKVISLKGEKSYSTIASAE